MLEIFGVAILTTQVKQDDVLNMGEVISTKHSTSCVKAHMGAYSTIVLKHGVLVIRFHQVMMYFFEFYGAIGRVCDEDYSTTLRMINKEPQTLNPVRDIEWEYSKGSKLELFAGFDGVITVPS